MNGNYEWNWQEVVSFQDINANKQANNTMRSYMRPGFLVPQLHFQEHGCCAVANVRVLPAIRQYLGQIMQLTT